MPARHLTDRLQKLRGNLKTVDRGDVNEPGGGGVTGFGLLHQRIDQGLGNHAPGLGGFRRGGLWHPARPVVEQRQRWHGESRSLATVWSLDARSVGKLLAGELREKLGEPVELDFSELASADFRMKAAGYKMLVDSGVPGADAARLAGLDAAGGRGPKMADTIQPAWTDVTWPATSLQS